MKARRLFSPTIRKNYADKPFAKEYAPVWDRFFGNGGR